MIILNCRELSRDKKKGDRKKTQHTRAVLETHVFDEKGMQHDISEAIILQGGEKGWLLEHKHRHNLCRCKPERQRQEQGKEKGNHNPNNDNNF